MIEKWYRSKAGELQLVYDRMPSFVRSGLTSVRGWALARNRYAPGAFRLLDELVSNERSTPEQIEQRQVKNLQRLLDLARQNCPFYEHYPSHCELSPSPTGLGFRFCLAPTSGKMLRP